MKGQIPRADVAQVDADPAFDTDIRRPEVAARVFCDQAGLRAVRHRDPDGDVAVVVVVVREHHETALVHLML